MMWNSAYTGYFRLPTGTHIERGMPLSPLFHALSQANDATPAPALFTSMKRTSLHAEDLALVRILFAMLEAKAFSSPY